MAYQIGEDCTTCGACAEVCPVDSIKRGDETYSIDADTCTSCGECSDTCPMGIITEA